MKPKKKALPENEHISYRRAFPDRRQTSLRSISAFLKSLFRSRRKGPRRKKDRNKEFFLF